MTQSAPDLEAMKAAIRAAVPPAGPMPNKQTIARQAVGVLRALDAGGWVLSRKAPETHLGFGPVPRKPGSLLKGVK